MKFLLLAFAFFMGLARFAQATTPEYIELREIPGFRIEATMAAGTSLQTGYLTSKGSVGSYILGVNFLMPGGVMSFEWQDFDADHDTGEFALKNNAMVSVSTMSFIPHAKIFARNAWNFYLGIGFANVGLQQKDPDYNIHYGTFVLAGLVRYELNPQWSVQYKTQWYNVAQTVNDQETSFEVWNHTLGVGYSFF